VGIDFFGITCFAIVPNTKTLSVSAKVAILYNGKFITILDEEIIGVDQLCVGVEMIAQLITSFPPLIEFKPLVEEFGEYLNQIASVCLSFDNFYISFKPKSIRANLGLNVQLGCLPYIDKCEYSHVFPVANINKNF
jgi:hypothetical protein